MACLPPEVIVEILSWLPVNSLLRFKSISKSWQTIISSLHFIHLQLNHSLQTNKPSLFFKSGQFFFDLHSQIDFQSPHHHQALQLHFPPMTEIFGSCNGLICLVTFTNSILLVNPSTRSYTQFPDAPSQPDHRFYVYGFGYSSSTHQYKVLRIVYFHLAKPEIQLRTIGTSSWRTINDDIPSDICDKSAGTLVNGSLHWIAIRTTKDNQELTRLYAIVSFDLRNEKFANIPLPEIEIDNSNMVILGELRDCLCMFRHFYKERVEIWVMKEYGVSHSWTQQFNIRQPTIFGGKPKYFKPFRLLHNDKFLLRRRNGKLIIYDPTTESSRDLIVRGVPHFFVSIDYVESLVTVTTEEPQDAKMAHCGM